MTNTASFIEERQRREKAEARADRAEGSLADLRAATAKVLK